MSITPEFYNISDAAKIMDTSENVILDLGMFWKGNKKLQLYVRLASVEAVPIKSNNGRYYSEKHNQKTLVGMFPVFQQQIIEIIKKGTLAGVAANPENKKSNKYCQFDFLLPEQLGKDDLFVKRQDLELFISESTPPYLDKENKYYIPELAALVGAWLALYHDRTLNVDPEAPTHAVIDFIKDDFPDVKPMATNLDNRESVPDKPYDPYLIKILNGGTGSKKKLLPIIAKENRP